MRGRAGFFLDGLVDLARFELSDRRGVFRQSITSLARAGSEDGDLLEALDPEALAKSVDLALKDALFDDLGWLAPEDAATAVYDLASALPLGNAKRELGRRTLSHLYEGPAATFVALATRMARSSARALAGSGIRARVALALGVPSTIGSVAADPLAYALVSRRELAADWLAGSKGSLPERRLAGRLLERAAREAAARSRQGDGDALKPFRQVLIATPEAPAEGPFADAWRSLLADRETLVWRHVASARGLLSGAVPEADEQIEQQLSPDLSPTEWRRASASLVASIAVNPEAALERAIKVLDSPLLKRDPGIAIAMIWGIPRAADAEPEACDELLDRISRSHALYTAEAVAELRLECVGVGDGAALIAADSIGATLGEVGEEELDALAREIQAELGQGKRTDLADAIDSALLAFVEEGTREAWSRSQRALGEAASLVASLEMIPVDKLGAALPGRRAQAATSLREFDRYLFESSTLRSLILLDKSPSQAGAGGGAFDDLDERVAKWLIRCESNAQPPGEAPSHIALHQRQLRALLHLVDGETSDFDTDNARRTRAQARWARTARLLLARLVDEGDSPFRRSVTATLARALDALVRDGAADPADVFLYAAARTKSPSDLEVLAEASMHPEVSELLAAYARFDQAVGDGGDEGALTALEAFARDLPGGATQRTEGLRGTVHRLTRALAALASIEALAPLADLDGSPLVALEDGLSRLGQLLQAAYRRCGDEAPRAETGGSGTYPLAVAVGRALASSDDSAATLEPYVTATIAAAGRALPRSIARVVAAVLPRIIHLPAEPVPVTLASPLEKPSGPPISLREARLPPWIPPRRTLGGFYVLRPLGHGSGGSVFVVTRAEERHDQNAERFALKVPDYDADAARSLSEADFMRLFRQEASALLDLPEHPNLARFVTFDAGAKPKPILVMALVEGMPVDQLIGTRTLTTPRALAILDGVLAGLEAMHEKGVGHLDVKPSNVILRGGGQTGLLDEHAVVVDFGLSGKHLRPGCGTGPYVAPEIWVSEPVDPSHVGAASDSDASPKTADVYAFGALAFELLTGRTLFDASNEVALIAAHLAHDGIPPLMKRLVADPGLEGLAMLLHSCLRRRPKDRIDISKARRELSRLQRGLVTRQWPL